MDTHKHMKENRDIVKIEITPNCIKNTKSFKNSDLVMQSYIGPDRTYKKYESWVSYAVNKSLEKILSLHHLNDVQKGIIKELYIIHEPDMEKKLRSIAKPAPKGGWMDQVKNKRR